MDKEKMLAKLFADCPLFQQVHALRQDPVRMNEFIDWVMDNVPDIEDEFDEVKLVLHMGTYLKLDNEKLKAELLRVLDMN